MQRIIAPTIIAAGLLMSCNVDAQPPALSASLQGTERSNGYRWQAVSGTGIHYFAGGYVHSESPTETGVILETTETVDLFGDLNGRILYQPTSVLDFVAGTLTNTGNQVFSGTVLGSGPVLLHDDEFQFVVNLATGETVGEVYLENRIAGERIRCELIIVDTAAREGGEPVDGQATVDYTGMCRVRMPNGEE